MKIGEVELGLIDYIDNEIAPKASSVQKFLIYSGAAIGAGKLETIFAKFKDNPIVTTLEIVDKNGEIDIDKLYKACKQAIQKVQTVEYAGLRFNEADVDSIYEYLKRRA